MLTAKEAFEKSAENSTSLPKVLLLLEEKITEACLVGQTLQTVLIPTSHKHGYFSLIPGSDGRYNDAPSVIKLASKMLEDLGFLVRHRMYDDSVSVEIRW